jgi:hypothetical protein
MLRIFRPTERPVSRLPRKLRITLWIALLAYVAYLIPANIFLNTPLAQRSINRVPERFRIDWSRAISLWPGGIIAWDVVTRGHARNVKWRADAQFAMGRIALLPLFRRELRLPRIDAHDVTFEAHQVEEIMPPREPSPRAWTVTLPVIASSTLREARWNDLRLAGMGDVSFGMSKVLRGGELEIFPSSLQMQDARLTRADSILLDKAAIDSTFSMIEHPPRQHPGRDKLELIVGTLGIDAEVTAMNLTLDDNDKLDVALQPGPGRLTVDLALERGEIKSGSTATLALPVSLAVEGDARRENVLTMQASVGDDIVILAQMPQQPGGRARLDAQLRIAQRALPLDGWKPLLPKTSGHIGLRWRFESLTWLSELLVKKPWLAFDGAGELDADLQVLAGRLAPGSHFELPDVRMVTHVLDDLVTGRGHAKGRIEAGKDGEPRASVNLLLQQFAMAPEATPDEPYVDGRDLALNLDSSGDLARFRDTLMARLRFRDAKVPDLTRYNHYLPQRNLRFTGGHGTLGGDLTLDAEGQVARGQFGVRALGAKMRLARIDMAGNVAIDTRLARADLERRSFDLDGTRIDLSRIAFTDPSGNARRDWWAKIELTRAHATWGRPLEVDGEAQIAMKDVGFLLALFAQKKKFPKWVARLVDAGEAQVQGQAQLRGKALVLDRLHAENDRFRVRGRLNLEDARATGDLLLHWGILTLGVELDESERDYRMIGATEWYESRPDLLEPLPPRSVPAK